ncbi:Ppx/GppA family phosphatase [Paenibacillus yanchengensis]|uniref:Ppx/GppA family phosphatase n=1 Tax=Paenibacillus yanchengensis TaxID=2035833 RepID=A0ABW4YQK1_9BACL
MNNNYTIGIIDIGSNSIRAVIYEITVTGAHRLIHENKISARLSQNIEPDGSLSKQALLELIPVLQQFQAICTRFQCRHIKVAATAAIRNATNCHAIIEEIKRQTKLPIQILSGEEEAYFGYVGVISNTTVESGFIIDIGGGSTEISLFRERKLIDSVSLPIGAVNSHISYGEPIAAWSEAQMELLTNQVTTLLQKHAFIANNKGLVAIGLGGTVRALSKLSQQRTNYPLQMIHYYEMEPATIDYFATLLPSFPLDKRKRLAGLSKSRADIIVSGVLILQTILHYMGANRLIVSGNGLRDGLLYEVAQLDIPHGQDVTIQQINSILAFHTVASDDHFQQVEQFSNQLWQLFSPYAEPEPIAEKLRYIAAKLYKIGSSIRYHQFEKHSLYWLVHSPIASLTHRETLLSAYIVATALGKGAKFTEPLTPYRSLLEASDPTVIMQIGSLLQIAIALSISETEAVQRIEPTLTTDKLHITIYTNTPIPLEEQALESATKVFKKAWTRELTWTFSTTSF